MQIGAYDFLLAMGIRARMSDEHSVSAEPNVLNLRRFHLNALFINYLMK